MFDGSEVCKDRFNVTVKFQSKSNNARFTLTTVYAPSDDEDRDAFFKTLDRVVELISGPWIMLGDVNMYRYPHEKSQGRKNWALMDRFNDWIRENAMDDIEVANRNFTWSNKRGKPTLIKLDRILINADWGLGFLHTSASALPAITSDHALIGVDFSCDLPRSMFFRFEDH